MLRKKKKVKRLIAEGDQLLKDNHLAEAEACYREALTLDDKNAEALYSLGCVAIKREDYSAAEAWAKSAVAQDPSHKNALFLMGNAQFGAGRFEDALKTLLSARPGEADVQPLAQLAFAYEKLGHLAEAEATFRSILEGHSSSYNTRYAVVALHDHSPFLADIQHGLARVLQRQGNNKEAWLHYHLCKRMDPTMELDPMFREIITEEDLENHPYFDVHEPSEPPERASFEEKTKYALEQRDLPELIKVADNFRFSEHLQELSDMIRAGQHFGYFIASARIRLIGDIANGDDAEPLSVALKTESCMRLLELSEKYHAGELDPQEVIRLAERVKVEGTVLPAFVALVRRFVRLDPETGRPVSAVLKASLDASGDEAARAYGRLVWGECCYSLRQYREAEAALDSACRGYERAKVFDYASSAFEKLCRVQCELGKPDSAEQTAIRYVVLAESSGTSDDLIAALSLLAQLQATVGNLRDSHATALRVADLINTHGSLPHIREGILSHLEKTARLTGLPVPNLPQAAHQTEDTEDTISRLISTAERIADQGQYEEACSLLESARAQALAQNRFAELVEVLFYLGQLHRVSGKLTDARQTLQEALGRCEPISATVDPWPILAELSLTTLAEGDKASAVEYIERALAEARRKGSREREAYCHEQLAYLLRDSDEARAIDHMGEFIKKSPGSKEDLPELLQQANDAFEKRQFPEAIAAFEAFLEDGATDSSERATVMANLGLAYYAIGNAQQATLHLSIAVDAVLEQQRPERAIELLRRLLTVQLEVGGDINPNFSRLVEVAKGVTNPGMSRTCLSAAAVVAADLERYKEAEEMARAALAIAASEEWRDRSAEMECRMTLGRLCRVTARYREAVEHYDAALIIAQYLKDEPTEGTIRGWKAVVHRYLHQLDLAREEYARAIKIAQRYHNTFEEAVHRFNLLPVMLDLDLRDEALETGLTALQLAVQDRQKRLINRILITISTYWTAEELPTEVSDLLREVEGEWLQSGDNMVRAFALTNRANRMIALGELEAGAKLFDEVIAINEQLGDLYNLTATYLNRARGMAALDWKSAAQDMMEARRLAESIQHQALIKECDEFLLQLGIRHEDEELVERVLQNVRPAWLSLRNTLASDADRIRFADRVSHMTEQCAQFFISRGLDDRAFDMLEWGRAQALSDLIASRAAMPSDAEETETESDEADALGTQVRPAPPIISVTPTTPADFSTSVKLLKTLQRPATLISLSYVAEELVALILREDSDAPDLCRTLFTRSKVKAWLEDYRLEMYEYRGQGALTWLNTAADLMNHLDAYIQPDDLVIFILEEELQPLPLSGFPLPDGQPLANRAAVAYVPSVTVLKQLAERKQARPQREHLDLASVGIAFPDEALAIQEFFGGIGLTGNAIAKDTVGTMIKGKNIVHFSCHGHFDTELPLQSGLHLRTPSSRFMNDILSVRDLSRWRLDSDLITLSACETGLGEVAVSEFIGLTRSLLAAGADSVIATLWPVKRQPTQDFMLAFYRELQQASKRSSYVDTAEVLRQTQRQFRTSVSFYDWAAFKLIGWPTFSIRQADRN